MYWALQQDLTQTPGANLRFPFFEKKDRNISREILSTPPGETTARVKGISLEILPNPLLPGVAAHLGPQNLGPEIAGTPQKPRF